jgi:type II secretory ATPase GspE/PulE/Tfp pilus assembly ATPase PilB-like protein
VSGKPLPAEPCDIVLGGRLVRLCCEKCKTEAERDPQATLAKLPPAPGAKPADATR